MLVHDLYQPPSEIARILWWLLCGSKQGEQVSTPLMHASFTQYSSARLTA